MHPILLQFEIFGFHPTIHTFGPLVALGAFLGILLIRRESMRRGYDPEVLTGIAVETLLTGVIGSRILFILITPEAFPRRPEDSFLHRNVLQYLALWNGGLVWYGGFVPGAFFALFRFRQLRLPWRTVADIFAPSIMLGLSVGRIGCLMAGDDHGRVVDGWKPGDPAPWWSVTFTDPHALLADELKGKPLYPSQIHMSLGAFAVFLTSFSLRKKLAQRPGATALVMLSLYPLHRFVVEIFRGDAVRKHIEIGSLRLSTSQAISIPFALVCLTLLALKLRKGVEPIELAPPGVAWPPVEAAAGAPEAGVVASPASPDAATPPTAPGVANSVEFIRARRSDETARRTDEPGVVQSLAAEVRSSPSGSAPAPGTSSVPLDARPSGLEHSADTRPGGSPGASSGGPPAG